MREFKSFDNDIPGRANDIKSRWCRLITAPPIDCACDGDRQGSGTLFINVNICAGGVGTIGENNDITRRGIINSRLQEPMREETILVAAVMVAGIT